MHSKNSAFLILLVAALVGPALVYHADWSNLSNTEYNSYNTGNLAAIPVRSPSTYDLSPSGVALPVSTVQVARESYNGSVVNPSRVAGSLIPAAPLPQDIILPGNEIGPDFNAVPLEFVPINHLGEIFRFDVDSNWIRNRWDQVATSVGSDGTSGYRVPLVTGVNPQDLFGSLTYFFDDRQSVQRITFRGWTGDSSSIINFVQQNFAFKKQPTSAAGLYVAKSWMKSTGALLLQHPSLVSNQPTTQKVALLLEINNPDGNSGLSREIASLIFQPMR